MGRNRRLVAVVLGALVVVGAVLVGTQVLGDDGGDTDDGGEPEVATVGPGPVVADELAFAPATVRVADGEDLVLRNEDGVTHTFTADDGLFDSGEVQPGAEFRFALAGPATVAYHCELHPSMTGTIEVSSP